MDCVVRVIGIAIIQAGLAGSDRQVLNYWKRGQIDERIRADRGAMRDILWGLPCRELRLKLREGHNEVVISLNCIMLRSYQVIDLYLLHSHSCVIGLVANALSTLIYGTNEPKL